MKDLKTVDQKQLLKGTKSVKEENKQCRSLLGKLYDRSGWVKDNSLAVLLISIVSVI